MKLESTGMPNVRRTLFARGAPTTRVLGTVTLVGMLVLSAFFWPIQASAATPEETLTVYLTTVYANDYPAAYEWISQQDQRVKTKAEYVREKDALSGVALEFASVLASLIRFENFQTKITGNRATVTFKVILPNANVPAIQELVLEFDQERLDALSLAEHAERVDALRKMIKTEQLPVIIGEHEQWELVREGGSWRVFLNWAGAVEVRFEAATKAGLPWEFVPAQPVVHAMPGETLKTFYRVKNLSDREITGKAKHILDPPEETSYLEVVFCFCFLQQTLDPGEEQELPVVFRVNYEVPDSIRQMRVRYEFYPIEKFPEKENK